VLELSDELLDELSELRLDILSLLVDVDESLELDDVIDDEDEDDELTELSD
jgi:hypothetical protein